MYVIDAAGVFAAVVVYFINCYFPSLALCFSLLKLQCTFCCLLHGITLETFVSFA